MIYEYAVAPGLFCNDGYMAFLQAAFGMEQGRLISDYPRRQWERLAREVIERNAPDEYFRRAWKEALIGLSRRALYERQGSVYEPDRPWLANAIAEHTAVGRPPFRAIVTNPGPPMHPDIVGAGAAINQHAAWGCVGSCDVNRNAATMLAAMAPALDLANLVVLIDRYFRPNDGVFLNPLQAIAEYLSSGARRHRVTQIKYVCSAVDMTRTSFEAGCRTSIAPILPRGIEVKFVMVPPQLLHDRFLLTNRAALQFGQGLDEATGLHEGVGQVLVTRLSQGPFERLLGQWRQWSEGAAARPTFTVPSSN